MGGYPCCCSPGGNCVIVKTCQGSNEFLANVVPSVPIGQGFTDSSTGLRYKVVSSAICDGSEVDLSSDILHTDGCGDFCTVPNGEIAVEYFGQTLGCSSWNNKTWILPDSGTIINSRYYWGFAVILGNSIPFFDECNQVGHGAEFSNQAITAQCNNPPGSVNLNYDHGASTAGCGFVYNQSYTPQEMQAGIDAGFLDITNQSAGGCPTTGYVRLYFL